MLSYHSALLANVHLLEINFALHLAGNIATFFAFDL